MVHRRYVLVLLVALLGFIVVHTPAQPSRSADSGILRDKGDKHFQSERSSSEPCAPLENPALRQPCQRTGCGSTRLDTMEVVPDYKVFASAFSAPAELRSIPDLDDEVAGENLLPSPLRQAKEHDAELQQLHTAKETSTSPQTQVEAVHGLLQRLLPEQAHLFHLNIRPAEEDNSGGAYFDVRTDGRTIEVVGSSGVELAAGIHWFLKYRCKCSVSWANTGGDQLDPDCLVPERLAEMAEQGRVRGDRPVAWSYYQNVVTASYSMAWWDWQRWEREIDWMALNGINLPLAHTGQEYIWQKVYAQFGVSEAEARQHFGGPAFLAWQRMGNIHSYAGPLPQSWIDSQAALQHKIVERMRAFGMTPVFPAFAGHVPEALTRAHPSAKLRRLEPWAGFPKRFSATYLLDPLDPLFTDIGSAFVRELRAEFGSDPVGYYSTDTFNENVPPSDDPEFLKAISAAVYKALASADESARWLMQAWLFFNERFFWKAPQIQGLLSGVPYGKLIMIDLYADVFPVWSRTESFYGVPFIWCMLHNFGGNIGMYGALPAVVDGVTSALDPESNTSVVGVGLCMEGTEQNPVVYDLMNEFAYRNSSIDLEWWVERYAERRYGPATPPEAQEAWRGLLATIYSCGDQHIDHVMDIPVSRPGLTSAEVGMWGLKPHLWYDPAQVVECWRLLVGCGGALGGSATFTYDLVDTGRQVLSKLATLLWQNVVAAYNGRRLEGVRQAGRRLLALLADLDELLSSHRGFLLGPRLEEAKACGGNEAEAALYEGNLRRQLTVWGTSDSGDSEIHDYANKMWGGLTANYYKRRWSMWLERLEADLEAGRPYNVSAWWAEVLGFTLNWTQQTNSFPTAPVGDTVEISQRLYDKYAHLVSADVLPMEE